MSAARGDWITIARAARARVESWIATREAPDPRGSRTRADDLLSGARTDRDGVEFTRRLLEALVDVHDPFAAALGLRELSHDLPESMRTRDRLAMRAGGLASLGAPWAVLPVARRHLRERLSSLVLSTRLPELGDRSARTAQFAAELRDHDSGPATERLILHAGEAVVGDIGAEAEIARLTALAALPEVTHLALDPSRVAPKSAIALGDWSLDDDAARGAGALLPLLEVARDAKTTIVFEASDYRGALLAPTLLEHALTGSVIGSRVGLSIPAELPEARELVEQAILLSRERARIGAEPIEITLRIAGIAAPEQIASMISGHPVPALLDAEASAQLLRLIDLVLAAELPIPLVVASEDPFLLAAATLLAEQASTQPPTLQLRAGTAAALAGALVAQGFQVRQRLPIAAPSEFSGSVASLIRLAADSADANSPIGRAAAFALSRSPLDGQTPSRENTPAPEPESVHEPWLNRASQDLALALDLAQAPFPPAHRARARSREWDPSNHEQTHFYVAPTDTERLDTGGLTAAVLGLGRDETGALIIASQGAPKRLPVISPSGFANEADTDASLRENRDWARRVLASARERRALGDATPPVDSAEQRETLLARASAAAASWNALRTSERAVRVGRLALGTASARDRLLAELAAESGAPVDLIDSDISHAVDTARYYAQTSRGLSSVRGAEFVPDRVALVVAGAGVSLGDRSEAVLAALAAGSAAILVAHPRIAASSAALIDEWCAAGLPEDAVTLAIPESTRGAHAAPPRDAGLQAEIDPLTELAAHLAADARIDRATVIGMRETARALIRRRPALKVDGRFWATGATIVSGSADLATAVSGAVSSAFGGGHTDLRATRALVLLGSAARSKDLRRRLADAVQSLRVGDSAGETEADPLSFDIGPLPQPPTIAGIRALTELQRGETWLVEPQQLDESGLLWSPGVRLGVKRDAPFWRDAIGMPVIGVATAASMSEALSLQRDVGGGAAAGLYAADPNETLPWLDGAAAASLSLGRPTTRGRVERMPVGGWDRAGMGAAPLAGGPNRLVALGSWRLREGSPSSTLHLRGLGPDVQAFIETIQPSIDYPSFDRLRRAALADALAWRQTLGRLHDEIGLGVEIHLLRHTPVSTHIRLGEGGSLVQLARVVAAGLVVGAPMSISTGGVLPPDISAFLANLSISVALERDEAWLERIAVSGAGSDAERVRLIGGDAVRSAEWLGGQDRIPLWSEAVTMAGPVELLAFLREQSIAIAAHRHGLAAPPAEVESWIVERDERVTRSGE